MTRNSVNKTYNALQIAIRSGKVDEVKNLLSTGDDVNSITAEDLEFLKLAEQKGEYKFAGYCGAMQIDTNKYHYEYDPLDNYDKYVMRYERIIPLGSYHAIKGMINNFKVNNSNTITLSKADVAKVFDVPENMILSLDNEKQSLDFLIFI